jgi:hypothetical protein
MTVDRAGCPSTGRHGTAWAYQKARCRCDDAKVAQRAYRKRRALLNARGIVGHDLTQRIPQWRVARRMQALARLGWSSRTVGEKAWGYDSGDGGWRKTTWMSKRHFDALDAVYRELSGQLGPSDAARRWAINRDWPSPAAWDNIDDPDEQPKTRRREDGRRAWENKKARRARQHQGEIAA